MPLVRLLYVLLSDRGLAPVKRDGVAQDSMSPPIILEMPLVLRISIPCLPGGMGIVRPVALSCIDNSPNLDVHDQKVILYVQARHSERYTAYQT